MQLIANQLACDRGGRRVFSNVSFAIGAGQLLEITGPNGSGKSTLLRLVAGLSEAAEGELRCQGGVADLSPGQQAHYVAHQDAIKPALTVVENLRFWGSFLGGGDVARGLVAFDLQSLADYPAALLSAGQKRRLSLARLSLVFRMIWLLDEPTVGLDAASGMRLSSAMRGHLSEGGLILAATHMPLGIRPDVSLNLAGTGSA